MKRTKKEWLNYIAAFFDGEGSATIRILKKDKLRIYYKFDPSISMVQKTEDVLLQIKGILGFGKIYKGNNNCYRYQISNHKDILKFIKLTIPYSIVKPIHLSLIKKLILFKETKTRNCPYIKKELDIMLKIRDELHKLNGGKIKYTTKHILRKLNCK